MMSLHLKIGLTLLSVAILANCTAATETSQPGKYAAPPDSLPGATASRDQVVAIVGGTLIDGNGGVPLPDAAILVEGKRIVAIGPRASTSVPAQARVIDVNGKFVTPGFIDTNVHLTEWGYGQTAVRYADRQTDIVLEAAQLGLKHGVTTMHDTHGLLKPLLQARDAINAGEVVGSRLLVNGGIVGWNGPGNRTIAGRPLESLYRTAFAKRHEDAISNGRGENLTAITDEDEMRAAIEAHFDAGADMIKIGGTDHGNDDVIFFSLRMQEVMVEVAHRRGKHAEAHSLGTLGMKVSVLAGIDLIQHPEIYFAHSPPMPDHIVELLRDRRVFCSMNLGEITGLLGRKRLEQLRHISDQEGGQRRIQVERERTGRADIMRGYGVELLRANARKIIAAGCLVTASSDLSCTKGDPAYDRSVDGSKNLNRTQESLPGTGTLCSIEGMVELGMSPAQAIVAATKHGAMAGRGIANYGTVEVGKYADLVILDANPLEDIHNIRKLHLVLKEGVVVDPSRLPERPVYYGIREVDQKEVKSKSQK